MKFFYSIFLEYLDSPQSLKFKLKKEKILAKYRPLLGLPKTLLKNEVSKK